MNGLRDDFTRHLQPMLRCINCDSAEPRLILKRSNYPEGAILGQSLAEDMLECHDCGESYPLTWDHIPIMWTDEIRSFFSGGDAAANTISANMAVYDHISLDYDAYIPQDEGSQKRVWVTVKRVLDGMRVSYDVQRIEIPNGGKRPFHLDYGCGQGQMLGWLRGFGFLQVGLDVSVANLRKARENTGALVVCGDASKMPFRDATFDIVTESAALHHVEPWQRAVGESIRVLKRAGGIVIDDEPTADQLDWSRLATLLFELRYPIYRLMSYVSRSKLVFRDSKLARTNYWIAGVHNQPGKGFSVDLVRLLFSEAGLSVETVLSPTSELESKAKPGWKSIVINVLNGKNPWNPKYGSFTAYAYRPASVL